MTYYAIGGEMNSLNSYNVSGVSTPADTTSHSGTEVRGCVVLSTSGGNYGDIAFIDPSTGLQLTSANGLSAFWSAFNYSGGNTSNVVLAEWHDATDTAYIRFIGTSTNFVVVLQYWNGTAWVALTNTFSWVYISYTRYDIHLTLTSPGVADVFVNNTLVASALPSINLSAIPKLTKLRIFNTDNAVTSFMGLWLISDTTTREHNVYFQTASAAGPEQQWTGLFSAINDFPESTASIIYSATAAQATTYTHAAFTLPNPNTLVKAVAVGAWMRHDSTGGPQNAHLRLTIGGTDYDKAVYAPDVNYYGRTAIWNTDPSTSAAWNGLTNVNQPFGIVSET